MTSTTPLALTTLRRRTEEFEFLSSEDLGKEIQVSTYIYPSETTAKVTLQVKDNHDTEIGYRRYEVHLGGVHVGWVSRFDGKGRWSIHLPGCFRHSMAFEAWVGGGGIMVGTERTLIEAYRTLLFEACHLGGYEVRADMKVLLERYSQEEA